MSSLSQDEQNALALLADMMIPASEQYDVPSANDEAIFAEILESAEPHQHAVSGILSALNELSQSRHSSAFNDLADSERSDVANALRASHSEPIGLLMTLVVQCYYRDGRVMRALEMEARPPFPQGYEIEKSDWALLKPVRERGKYYREV